MVRGAPGAAREHLTVLPDASTVAALLADDYTAAVLQGARDDIDAVLWRRDVRANAAVVAGASLARGARDSAAVDGADTAVVDDSPMGRVLAAAQRVTAAAPGQAETWGRAPLQVLAHLHVLTGRGMVDEEELGRPRSGGSADDPLNLGTLPADATPVGPHLVRLADWVSRSQDVPALVVAALVHAELMQLRPFTWGSGLVARASVRCVLVARGLDPSMFTIPELGMLEQGRGAYVNAIRGYASGDPAGLAASVRWFATAIGLGARAVQVP